MDNDGKVKTFIMKADIEFSAESIIDAFEKLEMHFADLRAGDDSEVELIELGKIEIYPKQEAT